MNTILKTRKISECIIDQLHNNPMSRKELVKFIIVDLKEQRTAEEFDKEYGKKFRGHYGTNFLEWERKGNIVRKDGIYSLAKGFYTSGRGLYTECYKKSLKKAHRHINHLYNTLQDRNRQISVLKEELRIANSKLYYANEELSNSKLEDLLRRNNYLLEQIRDNQ